MVNYYTYSKWSNQHSQKMDNNFGFLRHVSINHLQLQVFVTVTKENTNLSGYWQEITTTIPKTTEN